MQRSNKHPNGQTPSCDARKRAGVFITHIEGIVILEDELELSGKITNGPGHDAKSDGSGYKGGHMDERVL
jgi:hypothetical protein